LRSHASTHTGFDEGSSAAWAFFFDLDVFVGPSLPLSLEKKPGIFNHAVVAVDLIRSVVCSLEYNPNAQPKLYLARNWK
jgi:hypothetical protein